MADELTMEAVAQIYASARRELDLIEAEVMKDEALLLANEALLLAREEVNKLMTPHEARKANLSEIKVQAEKKLLELVDAHPELERTVMVDHGDEVQVRETERVVTPSWTTQHPDALELVNKLMAQGVYKTIKEITYEPKGLKGLIAAGALLPGVSIETKRSVAFKRGSM